MPQSLTHRIGAEEYGLIIVYICDIDPGSDPGLSPGHQCLSLVSSSHNQHVLVDALKVEGTFQLDVPGDGIYAEHVWFWVLLHDRVPELAKFIGTNN